MKTPTIDIVPPLAPLGDWWKGRGKKPTGAYFPTGLASLDAIIKGVWSHSLTLVGGPPGHGKTVLAVQTGMYAAEHGNPAAMLSLEMPRIAIEGRAVSTGTNIDFDTLMTAELTKPQIKVAEKAVKVLRNLPFYVDDRAGLNANRVYETLKTWGKRDGIKVAIIDFLQYIRGESESKVKQVEDSCQAAKDAAKETGMAVIAISSLNRGAANRSDTKPRLQDLRDSGALEFIADMILMFEYPNAGDRTLPKRLCNLHVLKNRNGKTGEAPLYFMQSRFHFLDRSERTRNV